MVAQGDVVVVAPRSFGGIQRPVVQVKVRSFDGVEVPVDLAESEDDMKKMTVQELKDKIQRVRGNPGTV